MLNDDQQKYFNYIIDCINDAVNDAEYCTRTVSLSGCAGSGKTYLTSKIIDSLLKTNISIKVTATTHKALKVLRDMLHLPEHINTSTIHSHLALKMKTNFQTGEQFLEQDNKGNIQRIQVLFCDESSMVSDELYTHIQNAIDRRLIKIIVFVGDSKQLLPIDGKQNPVYSGKYQYELTKIVRQAEGNKIIQLASIFRRCIENQTFLSNENIIKSIEHFSGDNIIRYRDFNDFMGHYFKEENREKEKFICTFTNNASEVYNKICRGVIKGEDIPPLIASDEVVFHDMHVEDDKVIHVNNEIVTIKFIETRIHDEFDDVYYFYCIDEENRSFNVIHPNSKRIWEKYLADIAFDAKSSKDHQERNNLWKKFFNLKQQIQHITFTYADTTHRCQGSSYDEVYIDFDEILSYRRYNNDDLIFRLLYVGITRARKTAIIKMK